jgi:hypothetical protein
MAKNDPLERITYLRKDTHLLVDGIWYVTEVCPYHGSPDGLVDEAVSWEEAKTPHHAGVIAGRRHHACALRADAEQQLLDAAAEITAAEELLTQQEQNLARAKDDLKAAFLKYKVPIEVGLSEFSGSIRSELEAVQQRVARHEHGLHEARRRVEETRKHNAHPIG